MLKMKKDTLGLDIQQKNIITPQTQKKIDNRNSVISLVSGAGAGVSSTIICSPLDVVKVRIQVQGSLGVLKYSGPFQSIRVIITEEGIRGLFRGIEPALMTVPLFWGMYFCFYDTFKQKLERQTSFSPTVTHLLSAVSAGAIGDIITNPLYVTRTRMQTTVLHHENIAYSNINIGMLQLMQRIYREEGFLAFYRGLGASFLGLSHVALQFPLCKSNSLF
jgi:solute carrier family 25 folate transporter 32